MNINLQSPIRFSEKTKEKQERPLMDEQSWSALLESWEADWITYTTNPDKVLAERGWKFYKEIVCDDTVHSCLEIKKTARLSTGWHIEPVSNDKINKNIVEFVEYNFKRMEGTFRKRLKDIYSAFEFGHSFSELNWEIIKSGYWKGKTGLKSIKTRDPEWIHYKTDIHGNINEIYQDGYWMSKGLRKIRQDKAVVYVPKPQFGNPYGQPECKYIYKSYIAKLWTIRFWNIALEKFGMPSMLGQYPPGTSQEQKDYLR